MIPTLIAIAIRIGIPERFARLAAWGFALIVAVLLLWGGWSLLKGWIITAHDTKQALEQERADRKADNNRAVERLDDAARLDREADELKGTQEHAPSDVDRRLARHRCLRMQQDARRDGRFAPACGRFQMP